VNHPPKVVYLTAGAGGMYCGSCLRDNALAAGLSALGWDVTLLPLYTPIRVDEEDRSIDQVFFGGINVYLQQKIPLFRHLPAFLDRWLDNPRLIKRVASGALSVSAKELGSLTLSMVKGEDGNQRKEVRRLVEWLRDVAKPDLICLTNLLVGGSIPALKRELGVPVLVTLQGDDVFLDELVEPWKSGVLAEMRRLAQTADGFLTFSGHYRIHMGDLLGIPSEKFHLTPLGVTVSEFDEVLAARRDRPTGQTLGYFARLSPEKGFDLAVSAFLELAPRFPELLFHAGGWLSPKDRDFHAAQVARIEAAGLSDRFRHLEAPDVEAKMEFLKGIDLFTVPARFVEPKGIYALEAMACGLPVVVPERGAFPEMIASGGGGLLCRSDDAGDLAAKLADLLEHPDKATALGHQGREWVEQCNSREAMARVTDAVFKRVLSGS
jgi:glycosyltransferase involved in cell wall biosynthesis